MSLLRRRTALATISAVALTVLAAACADAPTAPRAVTLTPGEAPSLEVVSPAVVATGLTRLTPLAEDEVVTVTVDPNGGTVRLPKSGLLLSIPNKAVSTRTTFTVTALAGSLVAYEFQPHGITFATPLKFEQDLKLTSAAKADFKGTLEGAYFKDRSEVNLADGTAVIHEFLPASVEVKSGKIKMFIEHFSGYMVSTGRGGFAGDDNSF